MAVDFAEVTWIAAPVERAFDLKLDVDVHVRSLATTGETASSRDGGARLELDDEVTFVARHFLITWHFTSRVTAYDRPRRFVDEQVEGPFAWFRHEHEFASHNGGTRMVDRVAFAAPLGPIGRLAEWVLVKRHLQALIAERAGYIKAVAEASDG